MFDSCSLPEFVDKQIRCIAGCNAYSYRKCNFFVQYSGLSFEKCHHLPLNTFLLKHNISAFCLDVNDLYVRGHCGTTPEPGVHSDKQRMNIYSSGSSSVHPGVKFCQ